jgi:hypothetical protein
MGGTFALTQGVSLVAWGPALVCADADQAGERTLVRGQGVGNDAEQPVRVLALRALESLDDYLAAIRGRCFGPRHVARSFDDACPVDAWALETWRG